MSLSDEGMCWESKLSSCSPNEKSMKKRHRCTASSANAILANSGPSGLLYESKHESHSQTSRIVRPRPRKISKQHLESNCSEALFSTPRKVYEYEEKFGYTTPPIIMRVLRGDITPEVCLNQRTGEENNFKSVQIHDADVAVIEGVSLLDEARSFDLCSFFSKYFCSTRVDKASICTKFDEASLWSDNVEMEEESNHVFRIFSS